MTAPRRMTASIPVSMVVPDAMVEPVEQVLSGEYEAGWSGSGLQVLDIGANVGAFSVWASLRWPDSDVHAYEPHPGTFQMLTANTSALTRVHRHNAAVFPTEQTRLPLRQRYDGDGESTLAQFASYFRPEVGQLVDVDVVHPRDLPRADVVKVDVEGAESDILGHLDLTSTGLVLLEYQNDATRDAVLALLQERFVLEHREDHPWDALLGSSDYAASMRGQSYGLLVFANRGEHPLQRTGPAGALHRVGEHQRGPAALARAARSRLRALSRRHR